MVAHGLIIMLLTIGALWIVWKYLVSPLIPDRPDQEEFERILSEKQEKLQSLRDEYNSVKKEKNVTEELEYLDKEIGYMIKEIKELEK